MNSIKGISIAAPIVVVSILLLVLVISPRDRVEDRWYTQSQLTIGKQVFDNNCAVCHGEVGQSIAEDWKKPLVDGTHAPPPVNGTGHAWHHPVSQLKRSIREGGQAIGGKMPGFQDQLSKNEIEAVIAYFQHWWPEDIYQDWHKRGGLKN